MTIPQANCPACGAVGTALGALPLRSQFQRMAPNQPQRQESLYATSGLAFDAYDMWRCSSCRVEFVAPMKAPAGQWYAYAYDELGLHATGRWEQDTVAAALSLDDKVVEIGCGAGEFLEHCRARGVRAHGLDFSTAAVQMCRQRGLSASELSLCEQNGEIAPPFTATAVASFHVIEHLEDPGLLFRMASRWSLSDAKLWISAPSDRRLDRLLGRADVMDEPPHHLTRWTHAGLRAVGIQNGWTLREFIYQPISIRQRLYDVMSATADNTQISSTSPAGWTGRAARYLRYPRVYARHRGVVQALSGFSMLACFVRDDEMGAY